MGGGSRVQKQYVIILNDLVELQNMLKTAPKNIVPITRVWMHLPYVWLTDFEKLDFFWKFRWQKTTKSLWTKFLAVSPIRLQKNKIFKICQPYFKLPLTNAVHILRNQSRGREFRNAYDWLQGHSSTQTHPRVAFTHPFWKTSHLGEAKVGCTSQVIFFRVGHWIYKNFRFTNEFMKSNYRI